jgi:hypothetical protein
MEQISFFLDKFKNLLPPDYVVKTAIFDVLNQDMKLNVPVSAIKVSGKKIFISADGYVKGELFQNQKEILDLLLIKLKNYTIDRVG